MPFVDLQDLRVHYEEAGSGRNVLVLVHGNFASSRWWRPVFARLPRGFRAYAVDLRGCGRTGSPSDGYEIPRLSGDVAAFVDALDLPAFHLVGHSLGGAVALDFALRRPERVRSLALVAPSPAGGLAAMRNGTSPSARMLRSLPSDPLSMFAMREAYRLHGALGTKRLMLRQALAKMMPGATLDAAAFEALLDDAARLRPEAVVGFFQALDGWNVEQQLPRFGVPTLVVGGGKDVLVPMAELERMAQLLRHGELRVWPEVGHSPQIERPDEFVDLLIAWTARARRGAWKRGLRRLLERLRGLLGSGSRSLPAAS